MPTQRAHTCGHLLDIALDRRQGFTRTLKKIEPDGSHPTPMEAVQFCVGDIGLDHDNAASPIAGLDKRVEQTGIIAAVEARLYDYKPLDAKARHETTILCQCPVRQGVVRLRDVRISFGWPEDVYMRVPGAGRQWDGRLRDRFEGTQWQREQWLVAHWDTSLLA